MANKLSTILKTLRMDSGDSLRDMSKKLEISPSYLSAIENNKREIPPDLEEKIVKCYNLTGQEAEELSLAIEQSVDVMKVDTKELSEEERKILFAISKGKVDKEAITQMCAVIDKNKKGNL